MLKLKLDWDLDGPCQLGQLQGCYPVFLAVSPNIDPKWSVTTSLFKTCSHMFTFLPPIPAIHTSVHGVPLGRNSVTVRPQRRPWNWREMDCKSCRSCITLSPPAMAAMDLDGKIWKSDFLGGKQRFMGNVGNLGTCFFLKFCRVLSTRGSMTRSWRWNVPQLVMAPFQIDGMFDPQTSTSSSKAFLRLRQFVDSWSNGSPGAHEETLQGPGHRDPDGYAAVICPKRAPPSQGPGSRWKSAFCPKVDPRNSRCSMPK